MATVELDEKRIEVKDGQHIRDASEELGVPFGCRHGVCGTCKIEITDGANNLGELTEEEIDMDRDKNHRLACQAKIMQGNVKIKIEEF